MARSSRPPAAAVASGAVTVSSVSETTTAPRAREVAARGVVADRREGDAREGEVGILEPRADDGDLVAAGERPAFGLDRVHDGRPVVVGVGARLGSRDEQHGLCVLEVHLDGRRERRAAVGRRGRVGRVDEDLGVGLDPDIGGRECPGAGAVAHWVEGHSLEREVRVEESRSRDGDGLTPRERPGHGGTRRRRGYRTGTRRRLRHRGRPRPTRCRRSS